MLEKVQDVLTDSDLINEIVSKIGDSVKETADVYKLNREKRIGEVLKLAGVTLEQYEEALSYSSRGYKVVYKRDITEIFINSYNIEWMRAWDGNMDIQPCFDYLQTITYITDYYGKMDEGLMEVIKALLKEDTSKSSKERMKKIANIFMTHRQIGEAEAAYRLLPNMVLKNSNISCQWLGVGRR